MFSIMSPSSMFFKVGEFITNNMPSKINARDKTSDQKIEPPSQMKRRSKSRHLFSRAFLFVPFNKINNNRTSHDN